MICGDNYAAENTEELARYSGGSRRSRRTSLAGPAFAGRYGIAAGTLCKEVRETGDTVRDGMPPSTPATIAGPEVFVTGEGFRPGPEKGPPTMLGIGTRLVDGLP